MIIMNELSHEAYSEKNEQNSFLVYEYVSLISFS